MERLGHGVDARCCRHRCVTPSGPHSRSSGGAVMEARRILGAPVVTRFLKFGHRSDFSRARLRSDVVSRLESFVVRLKQNFTFINERRRVHASITSCCVSLMFCGIVLGYCILVSLGIKAVARRSMKRVSVCIEVCSRLGHLRKSGPAIKVILYSRASTSVTECSVLGKGGRVFTAGCGACLPARRRLHGRVRERGCLCGLRRAALWGRGLVC